MKKINIETWIQICLLNAIAITFIVLLTTNNIQNYVHPRLNIWLWISSIVLIAMSISLIRLAKINKHANNCQVNIIMLVIFTLIILFPTKHPQTTRVETQKIATKIEKNLLEKYYESQVIEVRNEDFLQWFYDLNSNLNKYINKKVVYNAKIQSIDGMNVLATRSVMVCCAADLAALGVEINYQNTSNLKKGDWVKIEGNISQKYHSQFKIYVPIIEASTIVIINPIKNEILYP